MNIFWAQFVALKLQEGVIYAHAPLNVTGHHYIFFPLRVRIWGEGTLQYCICKLDTYHKPLYVQSQEFTCLYVFPDSPGTRPFMNVGILKHMYIYIYIYFFFINVLLYYCLIWFTLCMWTPSWTSVLAYSLSYIADSLPHRQSFHTVAMPLRRCPAT